MAASVAVAPAAERAVAWVAGVRVGAAMEKVAAERAAEVVVAMGEAMPAPAKVVVATGPVSMVAVRMVVGAVVTVLVTEVVVSEEAARALE